MREPIRIGSLLALVFLTGRLAAQSNGSGQIAAEGFHAANGAPSEWGRFEVLTNYDWTSPSGWQLSWRGTLRLDSRPPAGRMHLLDLDERHSVRPAVQIEKLALRRVWGGAQSSELRTELQFGLLPLRQGRTDGFTPTDRLGPQDFTDLLASRRPAVPAAKLGFYRGEHAVELIAIPFFSPDRLPPGLYGYDGRFSAPLPDQLILMVPAPLPVNLRYALDDADLPARTFSNAEWAVRYERVASAWEFSLSAKRGRQKGAAVTLELMELDLPARLARLRINREFSRVTQYGADFLLPRGAFIFRAEAAYEVIAAGNGNGNNEDQLLYTMEIEHQKGNWQTLIAFGDSNRARAGAGNFSQGTLPAAFVSLRRAVLGEWSLSCTGLYDVDRRGWLAGLTYARPFASNWRWEIGAEALGGPAGSFFGQFGGEDRLHAAMVWSW